VIIRPNLAREKILRESFLYPKIGRFLQNRGWLVRYEIPPRVGSARRFDVVGVNSRRNQAVVVEAKLGHYRRTVDQASHRQFVADFVYVSFPLAYAKGVARSHIHELEDLGIGLLGVDGRAYELLLPHQSKHVNPDRRVELINMVYKVRRRDG